MTRLPRLASAVAVVALLLIGATSTDAAWGASTSSRTRQQQVRAARAKKAAELNALKSSDAQLERAVRALADQVKTQSAKLASARQAVDAAEASVRALDQRIETTEADINGLQSAVVGRAVAAYVNPQRNTIAEIADAKDFGEASRRASLLQQVTNNDRDVIDQLHAKREDLGIDKDKAAAARKVAQKRRDVVKANLTELSTNLAEKARLEKALTARIAAIQAEAEALAAEDGRITDLIRRSSLARASRGDGSTGGDFRVSGMGLIWPISGPVTSEFGYRWGRLHAGIDIGDPAGTPIRAAKAGQVIFAGWMDGYGNCVIIDHGGGFSTLYGHQSRLGTGDGASVSQGEVIGYVGSTGHSTGNHLHFETRVNGSPQNPRRYL
jgi:murein DD-endopeptidase MepM/ murein hydrolase activator NlpD